MSLTPGTRLGPYEVVAPLGAGGMGEVYRATDTKLGRSVALKVLPDLFANDPERLARFTREAQVLASLNHPNIAAIYGLEGQALVMELVEGEDLSEVIARGPMTFVDVLPIARQIADAMEAAHEQGIIHRDLKPGNIKVRSDGTVKVLDFGLAKALDPGPWTQDSSNSPTLTARATQMGMIIGTAAYMSPEQARGRVVDRRADIWAFGAIVYEMFTGRRAFEGDDVSVTLASVIKEDPKWAALPGDLPSSVVRLLRRCLEKDPKRRLSSIGDARLELDEPDPVAATTAGPPAPAQAPRSRLTAWLLPMAAGIALTTLVALALWPKSSLDGSEAGAPTPRTLLAGIGVNASLVIDRGAGALLSPDGTTLAFTAQQGGQVRLFVRRLDQLQAAPLAGTEDAQHPFFSPNGQSIGFFAGGKLKKISVTGGAAVNLCDVENGRGGTWADDDTIIFSPSSGANATLLRVPAAGGTPLVFGTLSQGAITQRWPDALPGGKAVLYTESSSISDFDAANIVVTSFSADPSAKAEGAQVVVPQAYYGRYVPSGLASPKRAEREGGHLIYLQQGTLFAVPFDPVRLETMGPAVPVIDGLMSSSSSGGAQVAFSSEGTLVYVPGEATSNIFNPIDWLSRDGKVSALRATKSEWLNPRFSPDGQKLAVDIYDGKQRDIWIYDPARDTLTQLTFDPGSDSVPVWTHDNKRIVFTSDRAKPGGPRNLYWVNADGTGAVTRLTESPDDQRAMSVHRSGNFIAFTVGGTGTTGDLQILPMDGDATRGWTPGKPTVFLATPAVEFGPVFSPDGRFIAYFSNEAGGGAYDVYVRPFPGPGGPWRISTDGGRYPRWSKSEVLYLSGGTVMVAPYAVIGDSFRADKPQIWSPVNIRELGNQSPYDLHLDGKRIAAAVAGKEAAVQDKLVFMFNFFDHLRKVAPVKK